jgi:DNA-binding response OmpR family regulator
MNETILIVEDDPDYQAQLGLHLEKAGYTVLKAHSCATAREAFASGKPDLAVVDLMLEHLDDGFVLCHQFRKAIPKFPIVVVTSATRDTGIDLDADTPEERSWIKADALLHKPLHFDDLHAEILRLIPAGE